MKKSVEAALLSGLVFPGVGHIFLKRYAYGIPLLTAAAYVTYVIVSFIITTALNVSEKIQTGQIPVDMTGLSDLVSQQMGEAEGVNVAVTIFIVLWVISIADSYRQGRNIENKEESAG